MKDWKNFGTCKDKGCVGDMPPQNLHDLVHSFSLRHPHKISSPICEKKIDGACAPPVPPPPKSASDSTLVITKGVNQFYFLFYVFLIHIFFRYLHSL